MGLHELPQVESAASSRTTTRAQLLERRRAEYIAAVEATAERIAKDAV